MEKILGQNYLPNSYLIFVFSNSHLYRKEQRLYCMSSHDLDTLRQGLNRFDSVHLYSRIRIQIPTVDNIHEPTDVDTTVI